MPSHLQWWRCAFKLIIHAFSGNAFSGRPKVSHLQCRSRKTLKGITIATVLQWWWCAFKLNNSCFGNPFPGWPQVSHLAEVERHLRGWLWPLSLSNGDVHLSSFINSCFDNSFSGWPRLTELWRQPLHKHRPRQQTLLLPPVAKGAPQATETHVRAGAHAHTPLSPPPPPPPTHWHGAHTRHTQSYRRRMGS